MKKILSCCLCLLLASQPAWAIDFIHNVARQFTIDANFVDATDASPETALTPGSFTIRVYKNNKPVVSITPGTCTYATSTLTSTGTNPANNDTLTLTGTLHGAAGVGPLITEVYTYKTTLTGAANEIKIAGTAAATLDNTKCAINDNNTGCATGEGTDYGTGTVASLLVNATTNTDTTQVIVANIIGTVPNGFTTAETSAQLSWTGANLTSGNDNCIVHHANGKYAAAFGSSVFDTLGDINFDFAYTGVAVNWQKGRVVAWRSNEISVQGLGSSVDEFLETNLNTVGSSSAWAYKLNQLDIATSAIWDRLLSAHQLANTFGAALQPVRSETAQAGASTSITLDASASGSAEFYRHKRIRLVGGTGAGQTAIISAYNQSSKVATTFCEGSTAGAWFTNPSSDTIYVIEARNRQ